MPTDDSFKFLSARVRSLQSILVGSLKLPEANMLFKHIVTLFEKHRAMKMCSLDGLASQMEWEQTG